jgi:hypothetical protein
MLRFEFFQGLVLLLVVFEGLGLKLVFLCVVLELIFKDLKLVLPGGNLE